jgi:ABC-type tungstate transport system permease subunit
MKKLPAPDLASTGSSFQVVAGVRYEAQQRNRAREVDVVRVRFASREKAFVPVGVMSAARG